LIYRCFYLFAKRNIFRKGAGHEFFDLPVRQNLLSLQFVGWVERKAIPIAIQYNGDGFREGAAFRWNKALIALYARLTAVGKAHNAALIACARKLLIYANTVVQRGTPWNEKPLSV